MNVKKNELSKSIEHVLPKVKNLNDIPSRKKIIKKCSNFPKSEYLVIRERGFEPRYTRLTIGIMDNLNLNRKYKKTFLKLIFKINFFFFRNPHVACRAQPRQRLQQRRRRPRRVGVAAPPPRTGDRPPGPASMFIRQAEVEGRLR